jgi:hypothetical protein
MKEQLDILACTKTRASNGKNRRTEDILWLGSTDDDLGLGLRAADLNTREANLSELAVEELENSRGR